MEVPFLTLGARIIAVAGDRTRDVRSLAETCVELARRDGIVEETTITKAMEAIVRERRNLYEMHWKDLGVIEQNALRATAAEGSRLTTTVVLRQYGLKNTSRAVRALQDLDVHGIVVKDGDSYRFDDPFYRAWVISTTLRDVGVYLPITHVATSIGQS